MKPIILIVEYEVFLLECMVDFVTLAFNVEIVTASDGLSALKIVQQKRIDLIISDVKLPKMLARFGLNQQQQEVLELVMSGQSNMQIAQKVQLTGQAIKYHVDRLLKKFSVKTRTELSTRVYDPLSEMPEA